MGDTQNGCELIEEIVEQNKNSPVLKRMRQLCNSIIVNSTGNIIQSDLDIKVSTFISQQMMNLKEVARNAVRDIDPVDEIAFLRVKTTKHEIIISHEKEFSIISIRKEQNN